MSTHEAAGWNWADIEPVARVTTAVFSEHIGPYEEQLSFDAFSSSVGEAFPDANSLEMLVMAIYGQRADLQLNILEKLGRMKSSDRIASLQSIGHVAGGSVQMLRRCVEVSDQISTLWYSEAAVGLTLVSIMAVNQLVHYL